MRNYIGVLRTDFQAYQALQNCTVMTVIITQTPSFTICLMLLGAIPITGGKAQAQRGPVTPF